MHREVDSGGWSSEMGRRIFGPSLEDVITRHTRRARNADREAEREMDAMLSGESLPVRGRRG